jgi:hypothetical protein
MNNGPANVTPLTLRNRAGDVMAEEADALDQARAEYRTASDRSRDNRRKDYESQLRRAQDFHNALASLLARFNIDADDALGPYPNS